MPKPTIEQTLRENIITGDWVDLSAAHADEHDPTNADRWGEERQIPAELIVRLVTGRDAVAAPLYMLRLRGARVVGPLYLEAATVQCTLALERCFLDAVNLEQAEVPALYLSSSVITALSAAELKVQNSLDLRGTICSNGLNLSGGRIGGALALSGGKFRNPDGEAIRADGLQVDRDMFCGEGFEAEGEVRLLGGRIGGQLDLSGGKFRNPDGKAIIADRLQVDQNMFCREGFEAEGEVRLSGGRIGGRLDLSGGSLLGRGLALNMEGSVIDGKFIYRPLARPPGAIDLRDSRVGALDDNIDVWPATYHLDGFTYDGLAGVDSPQSVRQRLKWLSKNAPAYRPQIYNQLAATYRAAGHDSAARAVLIAKHRARRTSHQTPPNTRETPSGRIRRGTTIVASRSWDLFLRYSIAYGYRPLLIVPWLVGLLALGSLLFAHLHPALIHPRDPGPGQPGFQPFLYALDLLLPVADLGHRDAFTTDGAATWCAAGFALTGWLLALVLVAGLSGLFKRD